MTIEEMKNRLQQYFPDAQAEVTDLTGTMDHWAVDVKSSLFSGLSRIDQHQLVMKAFAEELKTGEVHALTIKTKIL